MLSRSSIVYAWLIGTMSFLPLMTSCSNFTKGEKFIIGEKISSADAPSLRTTLTAGEAIFYGLDQYSGRVNFIHPSSAQITSSAVLKSTPSPKSWFAGPNGRFFFAIDGKTVARQAQDEGNSENLLTMADTIVTVASAPKRGLYAFVDDTFSIGLIKVDDDGHLLKSWKSGLRIAGEYEISKSRFAGNVYDDTT